MALKGIYSGGKLVGVSDTTKQQSREPTAQEKVTNTPITKTSGGSSGGKSNQQPITQALPTTTPTTEQNMSKAGSQQPKVAINLAAQYGGVITSDNRFYPTTSRTFIPPGYQQAYGQSSMGGGVNFIYETQNKPQQNNPPKSQLLSQKPVTNISKQQSSVQPPPQPLTFKEKAIKFYRETSNTGGIEYVSKQNAKSYSQLIKEGDIPSVVRKTFDIGGQKFVGGTEYLKVKLGGQPLTPESQKIVGSIAGEQLLFAGFGTVTPTTTQLEKGLFESTDVLISSKSIPKGRTTVTSADFVTSRGEFGVAKGRTITLPSLTEGYQKSVSVVVGQKAKGPYLKSTGDFGYKREYFAVISKTSTQDITSRTAVQESRGFTFGEPQLKLPNGQSKLRQEEITNFFSRGKIIRSNNIQTSTGRVRGINKISQGRFISVNTNIGKTSKVYDVSNAEGLSQSLNIQIPKQTTSSTAVAESITFGVQPKPQSITPLSISKPKVSVRLEQPTQIKTETKQSSVNLSLPKSFEKYKIKSSNINLSLTNQASIQSSRFKTIQRTKNINKEGNINIEITKTESRSRFKQPQITILKTENISTRRGPINLSFPSFKTPTKRAEVIPRIRPLKQKQTQPSFLVSVKSRGKFKPIAYAPSTSKALSIGVGRVRKTKETTFKISPTSSFNYNLGTPKGFKRRSGNVFTERVNIGSIKI